MARALVASAPILMAGVLGLSAGVLLGWSLDVGPVGLVRAIESDPARRLSSWGLLGVAVLGAVVIASVVFLARRSALRPDHAAAPPVGSSLRLTAGAPPAVAIGTRAAIGPRSAFAVIGAAGVVAGVFVSATVFGASLTALVGSPGSYGWRWDVAALTGGGYDGVDVEVAGELVGGDPGVEEWTVLGFYNDISLDGEPLMTVLGLDRTSTVDFPLLAGRLPVADDEVAVGATTASARGLSVGDEVTISSAVEAQRATVTGIVVFPAFGPFQADHVGAGTGLLLPEAMVGEELSRTFASFVGVRLRDGAGGEAGRVLEELGTLGDSDTMMLADPVRPPELVDADSLRAVPAGVAVAFAVIAALGLGFASWSSVRSRSRELAVLRTLGFSGRQVRRSVRVQSLATVLVAMLFALPLGVVAGRVLWRGFANELGVVPDHASPWPLVAATLAGGAALAVLVAQLPAVIAARTRPADALRTE